MELFYIITKKISKKTKKVIVEFELLLHLNLIATLVKKTIQSYKVEENLPLKTAQERALSDYQFWYEESPERQKQLEEYIFNEK